MRCAGGSARDLWSVVVMGMRADTSAPGKLKAMAACLCQLFLVVPPVFLQPLLRSNKLVLG